MISQFSRNCANYDGPIFAKFSHLIWEIEPIYDGGLSQASYGKLNPLDGITKISVASTWLD